MHAYLGSVLALVLILRSLVAGQPVMKKMTVLSNLNKYPGQSYSNVWGWTGPGGHEYALVTVRQNGGVSVVDIKDPRNPREVTFIPSPSGIWHELKTYRNYCYKVADQGTAGIQIIDLSALPTRAMEVKQYTAGGIARAHNIWIDSTRALCYVQHSGGTDGIIILSLKDPINPVELGRVKTECHDMYALGNRLYVSTGYSESWSIWDVTRPEAPFRLSNTRFNTVNPGLGEPPGYSHNIWPSEDGKTVFTTEETEGTTVKAWDITDESKPVFLSAYVGIKGVIPHNVLVNKHFLYVAHSGAGTRIVDIRDPKNMKEVAVSDPGSGSVWGCYNWFPSGLIIQNDGNQGLFVVEPDSDIKITGGGGVGILKRKDMPEARKSRWVGQVGLLHRTGTGTHSMSIYALDGRERFSPRIR